MRDVENNRSIGRQHLYDILNRVGRVSDAASPQFAIIPLLMSYGIYGKKGEEIINLKWNNINFNIATITIESSGLKRVVDIGERMLAALKAALESSMYIDGSNQRNKLHQVGDYVLKSFVKDEQVNYWQLRKRYNLIFKTAGVQVKTNDIINGYLVLQLKRVYNKKHMLRYKDFYDIQVENGLVDITPYKVYNLINVFESVYSDVPVTTHERNKEIRRENL